MHEETRVLSHLASSHVNVMKNIKKKCDIL